MIRRTVKTVSLKSLIQDSSRRPLAPKTRNSAGLRAASSENTTPEGAACVRPVACQA